MTNPLYIAVDFFDPDAYTGLEDYAADHNFCYIVIQPLLLRQTDNKADPRNSLPLDDHLSQAAELDTFQAFLKADEHVPVPLPGGTIITLTADGTLLEQRTIGDIKDLSLTQDEWVTFIRQNYISLRVDKYEHLDGPQMAEFTDWAYALAVELHSQPVEILDDVKRKICDLLEKPSNACEWKRDFQSGNVPPAKTLFELVYPSATETIRPPRFICTDDALIKDCMRIKNGESYHSVLLRQLRDETVMDVEHKEKALGRLFAFGERLRWPKKSGSNRLMVLAQSEFSNEWCITNVQSLLGHVIRLPKKSFSELTLNVGGLSLPLTEAFPAFFDDTRANHQFSAALQRDPAAPDGRVSYMPRHARVQPSGFAFHDANLGIVPHVLLDVLDPFARLEALPGDWDGWNPMTVRFAALPAKNDAEVTKRYPPRTLIWKNDLHPKVRETLEKTSADKNRVHELLTRLAVQVRLTDVTGLDEKTETDRAYELSFTEEIHPKDRAAISDLLKGLKGTGFDLLFQDSASQPVPLPVGKKDVRAHDGSLDEPVRFIAPKEAFAKHSTPPTKSDLAAPVHLILPAASRDGDIGFNAVATREGNQPPLLALQSHFDLIQSLSTEQIFERYRLELSPAVSPGDKLNSIPLVAHFTNFNKLRAFISREDHTIPDLHGAIGKDDPNMIVLSFPDAMAPLAPRPNGTSVAEEPDYAPSQSLPSNFWYKITRSFTENVARANADVQATANEKMITEGPHFSLYASAGDDWYIGGIAEHQYGHRTKVKPATTRILHGDDVRNIAAIAAYVEPSDVKRAEKPKEKARVAALDYGYENGAIRITLDCAYLNLVLDRAAGTPQTAPKPGELRPLYEALIDLIHNDAELVIERWNFDNRAPRFDLATDEAFPSIVKHLTYVGSVTPYPSAAPLQAWLAPIVGEKFSDFVAQITALRDDSLGFVAFPLPKTVAENTDLLRVGVRVRRYDERVVSPDTPFTILPLPIATRETDTDLAELRDGLMSKHDEAEKAWKKYVSRDIDPDTHMRSPLRESIAWITSRDFGTERSTTKKNAFNEPPDRRKEKLLGDAAGFLTFPTEARTRVADVSKIYFVPHAFVPLKSHKAFGNAETTQEFVQFIVTLLGDIAAGRERTVVELKETSIADALEARLSARNLLDRDGGIADQLASLLDVVHDTTEMATWEGVEGQLFRYVHSLVRALDEADVTKPLLRRAIGRLLRDDPAVYARAKGLGIGIFDPDTFSEQLHSLQLTKNILPGSRVKPQTPPSIPDVDRFTFTHLHGEGSFRFFVDVLDDAMYEDDFTIDPNTLCRPNAAGNGVRGGAVARTAEDVIEQRHFFDDACDQAQRQLETTVVHYNPEWRRMRKDGMQQLYVLPSRRFPTIPVSAAPDRPESDTLNSPWHTRLSAFDGAKGDDNIDISQQRFETLVGEKMSQQLNLPGSATTPPMSATRTGEMLKPAFADGTGWHFVDTYLSIYYFIVEPNEENIITLDDFEIEVEISPQQFKTGDPPLRSDMVRRSPLQQWFAYSRAKHQGADTKPPQPSQISAKDAVDEIETWCLAPERKPEWTFTDPLLQRRPLPQPETQASANIRKTRFRRDNNEKWTLTRQGTPGADAVGCVVAADLLKVDGGELTPYVVRFAVLDDTWHYTRARLRVNRNFRDIDGDGDSDVNPLFEFTAVSDWRPYQHQKTSIVDTDSVPRKLRELVVDAKSGGVSFDAWLDGTASQSFGNVLRNFANLTFGTSDGRRASYWSPRMLDIHHAVGGEVLQVLPLRHVEIADVEGHLAVYAPDDPDAPPGRTFRTIHYLDHCSVAKLDELTKRIAPEVHIATPYLRVRWYASIQEGSETLMEITLPVVWSPTT